MGTKLSDMMGRLPKARRDRIASRVEEIRGEIHGLQALRKATAKTQVEMAKSLGVSQPSVAKIERQADMYLSTLRSYVEAAGGRLTLVVELKDGHRVELGGLVDMPRR
ncbi:MAG TPA: XRE family transcriptional regulator [Dongiaceae bacterium]|jgi:DNA-binding XRE family transcriptional regulator|nr:XRE family transcriptional regulator [Dongiaceae bacterium]